MNTQINMLVVLVILCLIFIIKNAVTLSHRDKIINAIFKYHMQCFHNSNDLVVNYYDMEDYDKTLLRLWDWTNKRILPKEKFEIIKPFI